MEKKPPIRVGVVFAVFPGTDHTPYEYFVVLLNRLQKSVEYEIFDCPEDDAYVRLLEHLSIEADMARDGLAAFGDRLRTFVEQEMDEYKLTKKIPDQFIVVSGVSLDDEYYLIRRGATTLLALGRWEAHMAPPSLAEFLQLLLLRAPFTALQRESWRSRHLGSRGCIFDFTSNLEYARLMALAGVGVCHDCEQALCRDGFPHAPAEIRRVARHRWRGDKAVSGTPANVMARLGYDLYLTRSFEPSLLEKLKGIVTEGVASEVIRIVFAILIAWAGIRIVGD